MVLLNILSFLTFPVWFVLFFWLYHPTNVSFPVSATAVAILVSLVIHELLHMAAIKVMDPSIRISYGLRLPFHVFVRIEGDMSTATRLVFLLAPLVVLSAVFWALSMLQGLSMAMVILATTNAAGSISDIVRSLSIVKDILKRKAVSST